MKDARIVFRKDRHAAIDVLADELRVFRPYSEELYREMTMLLTMDNFRQALAIARPPWNSCNHELCGLTASLPL